MRLQEWINSNLIGDEMLWKGAAWSQIFFVRDRLARLITKGTHYKVAEVLTECISTHRSKSIVLPVYRISNPELGLQIILRDNFYNWKMSVISETPLNVDFSGLFHTTPPVEPDYTGDELADCYFEGFPKDLIFGYYETSDKMRFSAEIGGDHSLWVAVWLIMKALGAIQPFEWNTKEAHRKELDNSRQHEEDRIFAVIRTLEGKLRNPDFNRDQANVDLAKEQLEAIKVVLADVQEFNKPLKKK